MRQKKGKRIVAGMMASSLALCMVLSVPLPDRVEAADESIAITEENFPDESFRDYLKEYYSEDNETIPGDISSLSVSDSDFYADGIENLDGIEKLTELESVELYGLDSLEGVDLSKNLKLQDITIEDCEALYDLKVNRNSNLSEIICTNTSVTDLDLSGCTQLSKLSCNNNLLSSLDLTNCTALVSLDCSENKLASLDLSAFDELTTLSCEYNPLTELDLSYNKKLERITYPDSVRLIDFRNQNTISNWQAIGEDSSKCHAITRDEDLGYVTLYDSNQQKWVTYFLEDNGSTPKGWHFYTGWHEVEPVSNWDYTAGGMEYFDEDGVRVTGQKVIDGETYLFAEDGTLVYSGSLSGLDDVPVDASVFKDANLRTYISKEYDQDHDGTLSPEEYLSVQFMYITGEGIGSLDGIERFTNLKVLYCGLNQLTSLDVSKLANLRELDCNGCKITSLNLSGANKLIRLDCSYNPLTRIDLSTLTELKQLSICDCKLTELDLRANKKLEELYCSGNSLSSLNVKDNQYLTVALQSGIKETGPTKEGDFVTSYYYADEGAGGSYYHIMVDPDTVVIAYDHPTHSWDSGKVTAAATCIKTGTKTYTCTVCGAKRIESIPKTNHRIVKDPAVAATVSRTGLTEGSHCSVCHKVIKAQQTVPKLSKKYSNEWVKGKWYNKDGTQTYKYTMSWKQNSKGYWIEDTKGWYPKNQWQKIDGKWYYFKANGYMASNEYCKGYWLNKNGSWTYKPKAKWKKDSVGWYYQDTKKWYAKSQWLKIDGKWYYFDPSGYSVTGSKKIGKKVYIFDDSGACLNP